MKRGIGIGKAGRTATNRSAEARHGNACMIVHICGDVLGTCCWNEAAGTVNCWVVDWNCRSPS